MGVDFFITFITISIVSQGSITVTDWWLSRWSDGFAKYSPIQNQSDATNILDHRSIFGLTNRIAIIIYSCLLIGAWILTATRCIGTVKIVTKSAKTYHNRMLKSILAAPIYFFDTNPIGMVNLAEISNIIIANYSKIRDLSFDCSQ